MLKYIVKRILIFIPTLIVISLATFYLSVHVPGDPVEQMLNSGSDAGSSANSLASEKAYIDKRKELGLDLPIFYFEVTNAAKPKYLYEVAKKFHRDNLGVLAERYGNWDKIAPYYESIKTFNLRAADVTKDSANGDILIGIKSNIQKLFLENDEQILKTTMADIQTELDSNAQVRTALQPAFDSTRNAYQTVLKTQQPNKHLIPAFYWYGTNNQYHRWIAKFIRGDFGISYQDGRPVKEVIWSALRWTLILSFISILLTYLIAVPLGITSAANKGSAKDQSITTSLFVLYSLPNFWVATLLIMFLGGGDFLDIFPANGVGQITEGMSFLEKLWTRAHHLVLPVICFTYGSLAFLSRQMRGAMINTLGQDYIRTARAKGLDEDTVLWKHALKNSLLPIITLFANVFPLLISGALVLEFKFTIPGMGKTAYEALLARNYPIVYTIVMFSAILTLVGFLVADILYAVVDPRIKFDKK